MSSWTEDFPRFVIKGPGPFIAQPREPRVTSHYTFREDGTLWDNINDREVPRRDPTRVAPLT